MERLLSVGPTPSFFLVTKDIKKNTISFSQLHRPSFYSCGGRWPLAEETEEWRQDDHMRQLVLARISCRQRWGGGCKTCFECLRPAYAVVSYEK